MHMQSLDDQANDEEKLEKLDQDHDKPFSPPSDIKGQGRLAQTHPDRDTDVDEDDWYSNGVNSATNQPDNPRDEPHHGRKVA